LSSATFINAVMEVRVEQGVFHFVLGEMVPGQSGKVEFVPAFRGVVPEGDAAPLFAYLKQKAEASTPKGVTGGANHDQPPENDNVTLARDNDLSGTIDPPSAEVVRKKKIATSDGEPQTT